MEKRSAIVLEMGERTLQSLARRIGEIDEKIELENCNQTEWRPI